MTWLPYLLLTAIVVGFYLWQRRRGERRFVQARDEALAQGLNEPPSLHPLVNAQRCIGSGGCVHACPEGALGIVGGKAVLVNAAACIGHGACHAACPVEAIQLVFGTERRGVDIPQLSPDFESNVPGLFIAGELGGMGLIRKAAEQGRQAVNAIAQRLRGAAAGAHDAALDLLIVGAGPAGLSAGLAAMEKGLRYRLVEQEDSLGGTVYHYPRNKIAMTAPVTLALVGKVRMGEIRKEDLLAFWQGVVARTGLAIHFRERLESVQARDGGFEVLTTQGRHRARAVLLAMGRRGTPRRLDVPGEDAPHVVYRLVDAAQYRGQRVLVVGGGDSALEAALALAAEPGTQATLAYRGKAFSRVKAANRQQLDAQVAAGRLQLRLQTEVGRIEPGAVWLRPAEAPGDEERLEADAVVVCAGGLLPTPLLQAMGVQFSTKHGSV